MVATKTGLAIEHQRLIYAGKQLRDGVALGEYMIHNQSTIHLVQHLKGGGSAQPFKAVSRPMPAHLPKAEDPCTLCYEIPALKLPCSHPYCSDCVTMHAWNEASQMAKLRSEVRCCQCNKEWSFKVLQEYGAMTQEEVQLLAECLSHNYLRDPEKFIQCPGCECYCQRGDKNNTRVSCHFCKSKGEFCWHCKKTWKSGENATKCANCIDDEILHDIKVAPLKEVIGVLCPSIRLCPGCGVRTQHKAACKQMKCEMCRLEFCFICLRGKQDGSWSCGLFNYKCAPAPIQSVVPRK